MRVRWKMGWKRWAILIAIALLAQVPFVVRLTRPAQAITASIPFEDNFERAEIGPDYFTGGGFWRRLLAHRRWRAAVARREEQPALAQRRPARRGGHRV